MTTVRTHQGDSVDKLADRHFGDTAMTVPILEANPGLAAKGVILPHGTPVKLPERQTPTRTGVNLWD